MSDDTTQSEKELSDEVDALINQVKALRAEIADDRATFTQPVFTMPEIAYNEPRSAFRDPEFDNDNVIASFTMSDNDFSNSIRMFVEAIAYEAASLTDKLTSEEKATYFRTIWNMTCYSLYYLTTVRAHQIENENDDMYEPAGWGNKYKTEAYMTRRMRVCFDQDAQEVFNKFSKEGNGEFAFVDKNGTYGFA